MSNEIHVGVDGCKAGWFYTAITDGAECESGFANRTREKEALLTNCINSIEEPCSPAGAGSPLRSGKLQGIFDRMDF